MAGGSMRLVSLRGRLTGKCIRRRPWCRYHRPRCGQNCEYPLAPARESPAITGGSTQRVWRWIIMLPAG